MQLLTDFSTAAIFRSLPRSPVVIPLRWRLDSLHCVNTAILQLRFYFWRSRQRDPNLASRVGGDPRLCFCGLKTFECTVCFCSGCFHWVSSLTFTGHYISLEVCTDSGRKKNPKSNEHTPPHTSDLTNTEFSDWKPLFALWVVHGETVVVLGIRSV